MYDHPEHNGDPSGGGVGGPVMLGVALSMAGSDLSFELQGGPKLRGKETLQAAFQLVQF